MPKSLLVEVVLCEYDEDEVRWTARGHIVSVCPTKDDANRLVARLIEVAEQRKART